MKICRANNFLCFLVLVLSVPTFLRAQMNGRLTGKVLNTKNDPLPGVSISVEGLSKGTSTDTDGRFTVVLPEGKKFTITLSAIGYRTKSISDIIINGNQTEELNLV